MMYKHHFWRNNQLSDSHGPTEAGKHLGFGGKSPKSRFSSSRAGSSVSSSGFGTQKSRFSMCFHEPVRVRELVISPEMMIIHPILLFKKDRFRSNCSSGSKKKSQKNNFFENLKIDFLKFPNFSIFRFF